MKRVVHRLLILAAVLLWFLTSMLGAVIRESSNTYFRGLSFFDDLKPHEIEEMFSVAQSVASDVFETMLLGGTIVIIVLVALAYWCQCKKTGAIEVKTGSELTENPSRNGMNEV